MKNSLERSYTEFFKKILNKKLEKILKNTSKETRVLIVDHLFVDCWEDVCNVWCGESMESLFAYPISYSMKNAPRESRSFGNQIFAIAISIKFYLENEMKGLSEAPLFFNEENIYSTLKLYHYDELEKSRKKSTHSFSNISTI